jgi:AmmeMemoRadiSam system protein B
MMAGEKFETHKRELIAEFRQSTVRKATHAGAAYPDRAEELKETLDGFFEPAAGPGPVDHFAGGSEVVAIAAPHIDLQRGGPCYAHAYKALVEGCRAHTFVILGILHQNAETPFIVIDKDFATPLGAIECDHEFTRELIARAGLASSDDELAHLHEHSVEFQAVFLKHLYGHSRPVRIVPVLCGPIAPGHNGAPMNAPAVAPFINALRGMLQEREGGAAVIASVDLSHVGKRFGDQVILTQEMLNALEVLDRALLRHAENADAAGFFAQNHENGDRTHVCGFPALYTLLNAVEPQRGRLLKYDQAPEQEAQSVVTFAAMAFYK